VLRLLRRLSALPRTHLVVLMLMMRMMSLHSDTLLTTVNLTLL